MISKLQVFNKAKENKKFKLAPALCATALTTAMLMPGCASESVEQDSLHIDFRSDFVMPADYMFNPFCWEYEEHPTGVYIITDNVSIDVPYEDFQQQLQEQYQPDEETFNFEIDGNTFSLDMQSVYEANVQAQTQLQESNELGKKIVPFTKPIAIITCNVLPAFVIYVMIYVFLDVKSVFQRKFSPKKDEKWANTKILKKLH